MAVVVGMGEGGGGGLVEGEAKSSLDPSHVSW